MAPPSKQVGAIFRAPTVKKTVTKKKKRKPSPAKKAAPLPVSKVEPALAEQVAQRKALDAATAQLLAKREAEKQKTVIDVIKEKKRQEELLTGRSVPTEEPLFGRPRTGMGRQLEVRPDKAFREKLPEPAKDIVVKAAVAASGAAPLAVGIFKKGKRALSEADVRLGRVTRPPLELLERVTGVGPTKLRQSAELSERLSKEPLRVGGVPVSIPVGRGVRLPVRKSVDVSFQAGLLSQGITTAKERPFTAVAVPFTIGLGVGGAMKLIGKLPRAFGKVTPVVLGGGLGTIFAVEEGRKLLTAESKFEAGRETAKTGIDLLAFGAGAKTAARGIDFATKKIQIRTEIMKTNKVTLPPAKPSMIRSLFRDISKPFAKDVRAIRASLKDIGKPFAKDVKLIKTSLKDLGKPFAKDLGLIRTSLKDLVKPFAKDIGITRASLKDVSGKFVGEVARVRGLVKPFARDVSEPFFRDIRIARKSLKDISKPFAKEIGITRTSLKNISGQFVSDVGRLKGLAGTFTRDASEPISKNIRVAQTSLKI